MAKELPPGQKCRYLLENFYNPDAPEEQARHQYIEVKGERKTRTPTSSSVFVQEHIDVFFQHIFSELQAYFKHETYDKVMIICGYSAAVSISFHLLLLKHD